MAFVCPAAHCARHGLLARDDAGVQEFALRAEVVAVVEDFAVGGGDVLVAEGADFAVHAEAFEVQVGEVEAGEAGGFVAAWRDGRR